ncbi:hypothetical protein AAIH69_05835 [Paenibacillus sp. MABNS29]
MTLYSRIGTGRFLGTQEAIDREADSADTSPLANCAWAVRTSETS